MNVYLIRIGADIFYIIVTRFVTDLFVFLVSSVSYNALFLDIKLYITNETP